MVTPSRAPSAAIDLTHPLFLLAECSEGVLDDPLSGVNGLEYTAFTGPLVFPTALLLCARPNVVTELDPAESSLAI